ncbi:DUF6888 family protein [Crocosphaera sp. XPORK-15E]|uniref:DUF6888 family protein n=1 Tax=Crocosphaera sp. XPORK-15E TaxID=3110247 RepID=UPI003A4DE7AE
MKRRLFSLPTTVQALICFDVCQRLTNLYLPIFMVRLDQRSGKIFILAGEETEILIDQNGEWDYL